MDSLFLLLWLSFVDHTQSNQIFANDPTTYEMNPVLGKEPSSGEMAIFGLAGSLAAYFADKKLSPSSHIIMDSVITSERLNVEANERVRQGFQRNEPILIAVTVHF